MGETSDPRTVSRTGGRAYGRASPCWLLAPLMLLGGWAPAVGGADGPTVRVRDSDPDRIVLEVEAGPLETEPVVVEGTVYERVTLAGGGLTAEPGHPALPFYGILVGIPFDRDPALEAEVLESRDLGAKRILPAPRYHPQDRDSEFPGWVASYEPDPEAYATTRSLPGILAEVVSVSRMRFQRTALLRVYPLAYRPAEGRLTLRGRVRLTLRLKPRDDAKAEPGELPPREEVWDGLYRRAIANFRSAGGWQRAPSKVPGQPSPALGQAEVEFRIRIDSTGVYELTYPELQTAGLAEELPIDSIGIYQRSFEPDSTDPFAVHPLAVEVCDFDRDGAFNGSDRVVFFARSFREQWVRADWEDLFTGTNVYWFGKNARGRARMDTVLMPAGLCPAETLRWTWRRSWFEEEHVFDYQPSRLEKDRTHWVSPNVHEAEIPFPLEHVYPAAAGTLRVHFEDIRPRDGISCLSVSLRNPTGGALESGEFGLPDHGGLTRTLEIAPAFLGTGEHVLHFSGYRRSGSQVSEEMGASLDWFELVHPSSSIVRDRYLQLAVPADGGTRCVAARGFSSPQVSLFDVSNPFAPRRVIVTRSDIQSSPGGDGFELTVRVSDGPGRWVALEEGGLRRLASGSLERRESAGLHAREADYLIIGPEVFLPEVTPLAAHREAEGYRVQVSRVSDVYDEFGGGFKSAQAIKRYLAYGFEHWARRPQFVLLVGDASEDRKGVLEASDPDWVPTEVVSGYLVGRAASDAWYGCIDDDHLLDIFVGRLSAGSPEELRSQVDKILAYELEGKAPYWRQRVVLLADDAYSSLDFGEYTRVEIEECFESVLKTAGGMAVGSSGCRVDTLAFFLSRYTGRSDSEGYHLVCAGTPDFLGCVRDSVSLGVTGPLTRSLNEGCLVFAYLGHGFRKGMAHEYVLVDGIRVLDQGQSRWRHDVQERLESNGRAFFCAGFGCLLADFDPPDEARDGDAMLEKFMSLDGGGAIAGLGSSTSEVFFAETAYTQALFTSMFVDPPVRGAGTGEQEWVLGELAARTAARVLTLHQDAGVVDRRILFGDPALRLRSRPVGFEVTADGMPLRSGDSLVVPADSTTARIRATVPLSVVEGPDSLWVEVRDASGSARLVPDVDYTVRVETSGETPVLLLELEHEVRLADYCLVIGAATRTGAELTHEIRVVLETVTTAEGRPLIDGDPVGIGTRVRLSAVLPWRLSAEALGLFLAGAGGEVPLEVEVVADHPELGNAWTLEFVVPSLPRGEYRLILAAVDEKVEVLRLTLRAEITIEELTVYPNPFSDFADFAFRLSTGGDVRVDIFTVAGRPVRTLRFGGTVGYNSVTWDGRDQENARVANGTYLYRVTVRCGGEKIESPIGRVGLMR